MKKRLHSFIFTAISLPLIAAGLPAGQSGSGGAAGVRVV